MRGGGAAIISGDGLGFVDWTYADGSPQKAPRRKAPRRRLPSTIKAQLEKVADKADAAATTDDPDSDSIIVFIDEVNRGDYDAANLPLREILGLDGSLKTIRGNKAVQESKKSLSSS